MHTSRTLPLFIAALIATSVCNGAKQEEVAHIIDRFHPCALTPYDEIANDLSRERLHATLKETGASCPTLRANVVNCCSKPRKLHSVTTIASLLCSVPSSLCCPSPVAECCACAAVSGIGYTFLDIFMRSEHPTLFADFAAFICGINRDIRTHRRLHEPYA